MLRWLLVLALLSLSAPARAAIRVGSKKFTESVILGEMACQLARDAGLEVEHIRELGGTQVVWQALQGGEIDAYPDYSGTIALDILKHHGSIPMDQLAIELAAQGVIVSGSLGFNNSYALGLRKQRAAELGLASISDLARHPDLALRFSNEFVDRQDGWRALRSAYGLPHQDVLGLDHSLAYQALASGQIDVMDLYTTDAEIVQYDLALLDDDKGFFPTYEAVFLVREDVAPKLLGALGRIEGRIDDKTMATLNMRAKVEGKSESLVAAEYLRAEHGIAVNAPSDTRAGRLLVHTLEHLELVGISLLAAIAAAVPLGIAAARRRRLGQAILGVVGVMQTIPSLALLVFMIPLLGIGKIPAIVALWVYSLLPIVRNTHEGLTAIPRPLIESAEALGLPARARLWQIELPLASRSILAGIKIAAVLNVATATLGALIGAGGYGQPIVTGIRRLDIPRIMEGAIPAAVLALLIQAAFELSERVLVPRGLRLGR